MYGITIHTTICYCIYRTRGVTKSRPVTKLRQVPCKQRSTRSVWKPVQVQVEDGEEELEERVITGYSNETRKQRVQVGFKQESYQVQEIVRYEMVDAMVQRIHGYTDVKLWKHVVIDRMRVKKYAWMKLLKMMRREGVTQFYKFCALASAVLMQMVSLGCLIYFSVRLQI